MERLTKWENGHAYYTRCFKDPCYGSGCKIKDCPFETAVCERLAAYEDIGMTPEEIKAPFTEDTMINLAAQALGVEPSRLRELAEASCYFHQEIKTRIITSALQARYIRLLRSNQFRQ